MLYSGEYKKINLDTNVTMRSSNTIIVEAENTEEATLKAEKILKDMGNRHEEFKLKTEVTEVAAIIFENYISNISVVKTAR